jgi:hypothetical protein
LIGWAINLALRVEIHFESVPSGTVVKVLDWEARKRLQIDIIGKSFTGDCMASDFKEVLAILDNSLHDGPVMANCSLDLGLQTKTSSTAGSKAGSKAGCNASDTNRPAVMPNVVVIKSDL